MTSTATRRSVKWTNRRGTHTASLGTYGQPGALDLVVDGNTGHEIAATIPGAELATWQEARKAALATADALTADLEEFAR